MNQDNPETPDTTEAPPSPPQWRRVTRLPVQDELIRVLHEVKNAAESELTRLREQLDKARTGG